jgi:nucleoside-diphosphate-sugar epimerase
MFVFLTGATGWVGSAVIEELVTVGHTVTGLARSDASAARLASTGVIVQRGSLEDLESLRSGAAAADAVIHTAFDNDFSRFAENGATETRMTKALGTRQPLPPPEAVAPTFVYLASDESDDVTGQIISTDASATA